jgi:hypothetical protein
MIPLKTTISILYKNQSIDGCELLVLHWQETGGIATEK